MVKVEGLWPGISKTIDDAQIQARVMGSPASFYN